MSAFQKQVHSKKRRPDLRGLIWDLPTRLFHWSLALGFAACYLTGEDDRWALLHITSGYMITGLLGFRCLWGFLGSRHARFSDFVKSPRHVGLYLRDFFRGKPAHFAGHNPAGGWAIMALILIGIGVCLSGILLLEEVPWPPLEWLHDAAAQAMLGLVGLHLLGVLLGSLLHRENLVKAMITGRKVGFSREAIQHGHFGLALSLLVALVVFWLWSYRDQWL